MSHPNGSDPSVGTEAILGPGPANDADVWEQIDALRKRCDDLERDNAILTERQTYDTRTGLYRIHVLEAWAHNRILRGIPFAVAWFDLDAFSQVNNVHGYDAGNVALRAAGDALRGNVRGMRDGGDIAARHRDASDELLVGITEHWRAVETAERVRSAIVEAVKRWGAGCSVGVATYPHDVGTWDDLLRASSLRMKADKRARKAGRPL